MTISTRSKLIGIGASAIFALALAGCNNQHDDDGSSPPAAANVNDLATSQINTKTCETRRPDEVNGIALGSSEEAIDVATLTPACAGAL